MGDDRKLTIIRGEIYDISKFMDAHPGGRQLVNLAVGRDATILFESYHIRDDVVDARLKSLPKVTDVTVEDLAAGRSVEFDFPPGDPLYTTSEKDGKDIRTVVDDFVSPGKSELFQVLRSRIRKEVLGKIPGRKMGRGGIVRDSICVVLFYIMSMYFLITRCTWWSAIMCGCAAAWVGFGVQHTANHGGLTNSRLINAIVGMGDDVACGGSSLIWRYHHMVSHHLYTNVLDKDMDVYSSFPMMRFDDRQKREWFHKFQWLYAPVAFSFLYWSIQLQDWQFFLAGKCHDVRLLGVQNSENVLFVVGKALHMFFSLFLPMYFHGLSAIPMFILFAHTGGLVLSWFFIVSHNLEDTKPSSFGEETSKDWARWQIETSATWGGPIASFFTGGLNYQIEHHLFPGLAHNLYSEIQPIIQEECKKRNIPYYGFSNIL